MATDVSSYPNRTTKLGSILRFGEDKRIFFLHIKPVSTFILLLHGSGRPPVSAAAAAAAALGILLAHALLLQRLGS